MMKEEAPRNRIVNRDSSKVLDNANILPLARLLITKGRSIKMKKGKADFQKTQSRKKAFMKSSRWGQMK
ncbi:hypothetical protein HAX54_049170, partial [Datura stramonium]|nr:hypothetical protein [Datura stramonium]